MAIYTNSYETFDSNDKREDLANVIYNISPTETPFMSSIGTGQRTGRNTNGNQIVWQQQQLT